MNSNCDHQYGDWQDFEAHQERTCYDCGHVEYNEPEIACPKCQSTNWRCWDERTEWFEHADGELYEAPVGYMACKDCGAAFTHHDEGGSTHVGDERDAFGEND